MGSISRPGATDAVDLERLTKALLEAAERIAAPHPVPPLPRADQPFAAMTAGDRASYIVSHRRRRTIAFGEHAGMFGEPTWDILLDLFSREERRKETDVSSSCAASGVPQTTALRHIQRLVRVGLVERSPDSFDRRRIYLRLTEECSRMIRGYLDGL